MRPSRSFRPKRRFLATALRCLAIALIAVAPVGMVGMQPAAAGAATAMIRDLPSVGQTADVSAHDHAAGPDRHGAGGERSTHQGIGDGCCVVGCAVAVLAEEAAGFPPFRLEDSPPPAAEPVSGRGISPPHRPPRLRT